MIVRTACLEGRVAPEHQHRFDRFMVDEIVPLMRDFPGVRAVRVLRADTVEDGGPPLYMVFESTYDSFEAMEAALASPARQRLRTRLAEAMAWFDGRVFHVNQLLLADAAVAAAAAA